MLLNEAARPDRRWKHKDITGFVERNRWFNHDVSSSHRERLCQRAEKTRGQPGNQENARRVPHKRVYGRNIFVRTCNPNCYPLSTAITPLRPRWTLTALQRGQTVQ